MCGPFEPNVSEYAFIVLSFAVLLSPYQKIPVHLFIIQLDDTLQHLNRQQPTFWSTMESANDKTINTSQNPTAKRPVSSKNNENC